MAAPSKKKAVRDELEDYATRLRADLDSKRPSVRAEYFWAYQEPEVREAVAKRLDAGETLVAKDILLPDIVLRTRRVYFQFAPSHGSDETHPGILVQLWEDNEVHEIIDPFLLAGDQKPLVALQNGTFPLTYSGPFLRSGVDSGRHITNFEDLVKREGLEAAFEEGMMTPLARGASGEGEGGGEGGFKSGTCVATSNPYPGPVIKGRGEPEGISQSDVSYEEDDASIY